MELKPFVVMERRINRKNDEHKSEGFFCFLDFTIRILILIQLS